MDDFQRRKNRLRRCYYCRQRGHFINRCKIKERDDATVLIRQAANPNLLDADYAEEYMVTGTDNKSWNDIWYVNSDYDNHMSGFLSQFHCIKHSYGIETRLNDYHIVYIRGIGKISLPINGKSTLLSSVYYAPNLEKNVLSLKQLRMQGYTVIIEGTKCSIKNMFDEEEIIKPDQFDQKKLEKESMEAYFELLELSQDNSKDEKIDNLIYGLEITRFEDCVALLDLIETTQNLWGHREAFKIKFSQMVDWFLHDYLMLQNRPVPPLQNMPNKFELFDLYMILKLEGGFHYVNTYNLWSMVLKDLGLSMDDLELVKVIYIQYLEVLIWNYQVFKRARRGESVANGYEQPGLEGLNEKEYGLYMGNDWLGAKHLFNKRKFDFNKATTAVIEAMHQNGDSSHTNKEMQDVSRRNEEGTGSVKDDGSSTGSNEDWIKVKTRKKDPAWKASGWSWTKLHGWRKTR